MKEIDPQELHNLLSSSNPPILIDCREDDEWALCRIEGACHAPLSRFPENIGPILSKANGAPVVIYCAHGFRSLRAVRYLEQRGTPNVFSLRGGLKAWAMLFDPSLPVD